MLFLPEQRRGERIVFAATAALALAWSVASLSWPFAWDQGIFASIGDVILRGGLPYRDGWDTKGPLAFYGYALVQAIFGRTTWGIRLLDLVFLAGGALAVNRALVDATSRRVAAWTTLIFVLAFASLGYWDTAQPDGWVAMLSLVGLGWCVREKLAPNNTRLALAGIAIGLCALVKPLYAVLGIVALIRVVQAHRHEARKLVSGVLVLSGAFLLPIALCVAWFWSHGGLNELIDVYIIYTVKVYSRITQLSPLERASGLRFVETGRGIAVGMPLVMVGAYALWREHRGLAVTLGSWAALAIVCVVAQNRFLGYHWAPAFGPLALLGGYGAWYASRAAGEVQYQRVLVAIIAAAVVADVSARPALDVARFASLISGRTNSDAYLARFRLQGGFYDSGSDVRAARYVRTRTKGGDRIEVWGWNAAIYFLSGRAAPSRFVFTAPLIGGRGTSYRAAYRTEFIERMRTVVPIYFLIGTPYARSKATSLVEFPELNDIIRERYLLETRVGSVDIYRRIDNP